MPNEFVDKVLYAACQDKQILGVYDTLEDAERECLNELERDKFWLIFKKRILKKILKNKLPLSWSHSRYYVARIVKVVHEEVPSE